MTRPKSQRFLSVLTWPGTRQVAFELEGGATAVLTNGRHGSDWSDHAGWAAATLGLAAVRYVDRLARTSSRAGLKGTLSYEARIGGRRQAAILMAAGRTAPALGAGR